MNKILYFLIICPFLSLAQSITIEYDVTLNILNRKGVLIINDTIKSFYIEEQILKTYEKQNTDEDGLNNTTIYLGSIKEKKRMQLYKKEMDTLINVDYIEDKKVICFELFPKMIWKLEDETRTISNYLCNKASITFRGRNYIAWFTSDISSNVGPWKFNNLPGAILQVYDESMNFSWLANKIIINEQQKKIDFDKDLKKLSLKQFVEEAEKLKKEKSDMMLIKYAERGAEVVERKYNRGREKTFEWEK
jgi:GLPGLI family protein